MSFGPITQTRVFGPITQTRVRPTAQGARKEGLPPLSMGAVVAWRAAWHPDPTASGSPLSGPNTLTWLRIPPGHRGTTMLDATMVTVLVSLPR